MKKHRNYTARKYRISRQIIFYVIVAIVIFVLAMILGNHLKGKVDSIDHSTTDVLEETGPEKDPGEDKDEKEWEAEHDPALAGVSCGYLSLSADSDMVGARRAVEAIRTSGCNAVSFRVTDNDGKLTYRSPAIEEATRLPAAEALIPFEVLSEAFKAAGDMDMRVSCVMDASDSLSDPMIAKELYGAGADEIVITGFEEYTVVNNDTVSSIREYTDKLRKAVSGEVGIAVAFAPEFYTDPHNAPFIEKIYKCCEFLAIDMTGADAESVTETARELAGSFTAYLLRPVLSGEDADLVGEIDAALTELSISARQYISAPEPEGDDGDE